MGFKPTDRKRQAFTLLEFIFSVALGMLLLAGAGSFFLFGLRSFAAMYNYADLNMRSRNATDVISRDIRSSYGIISASSSQLVLDLDSITATYTYSPSARTLTRTQSGVSQVLLTQIDSFSFSLYGRPTGAAYEAFPPATAATAKLVGFQWTCSRQTPNSHSDSQSVQTALVEMRNQ
jgi:Tfp pilus assembly protein PilW